ncbi:ATP-binding cassette domain-containing protein [Bacillus ndiopicus]|uniref:ATP-binding cassette domain-containing protein n=1 Tax=Bacillus ndiopicus TaxID=1347368 RepID=UPI0005A9D36C|nr:ABC transporter ATP-binding protein [Bacillus ndiopicus]
MIKLVISLFRGKWKLAFISFLLLMVLSLDGIVFPYFLGKFTDVMTNQEYDQIPLLLFIWFVLWLLIVAAQLWNNYVFGKLRSKINIDLKDKMFKKSYDAGNSKVPASQYISTITSDIKQIEQDFINSTMNFIYSILQGGITLVFLLFINWKVGMIFVLLGTLPTLIPKLTSRWLQKGTENWQEANHQYIGQLEDGLNARNLVKRYGAKNLMFKQLLGAVTTEQNKYFSMNFRRATSSFYVGALYVVSAMGSLSYGAWSVINGEISTGMLITIYMAADRVVSPLISLANIYNAMTASEPLLRKVLNEEPTHVQPAEPAFTTSDDYLISLGNVSIGFEEDKPILENINLQVERGDRILIEGASGSGKSTLLKTIMNEQDTLSGEIKYGSSLNGNLTEAFAVVEQQPFVFRNTLKYNLMIGHDIADERLYEVLHKVGLNRLANEEGLQIQLGSDAHQLSGGELKRLEVARAMLSNKEILVVDEALSGLDGENADRLNQLITSYPGTVMNIEHRIDEEIRERFNKKLKL